MGETPWYSALGPENVINEPSFLCPARSRKQGAVDKIKGPFIKKSFCSLYEYGGPPKPNSLALEFARREVNGTTLCSNLRDNGRR